MTIDTPVELVLLFLVISRLELGRLLTTWILGYSLDLHYV